jgi:hypothetical protein
MVMHDRVLSPPTAQRERERMAGSIPARRDTKVAETDSMHMISTSRSELRPTRSAAHWACLRELAETDSRLSRES